MVPPEANPGVPVGVLTEVASYNEGMLAMLSSGHLFTFPDYTDRERAAFHEGYNRGVNDSMVLLGTLIVTFGFALVLLLPALYLPLRQWIRPWAMARVKAEHAWLMAIQRYQHPAVTWAFQIIGWHCGVAFYITFLPLLFWIGEVRLARQLTSFMSCCIYVGNALKDTICSPRPDWKGGVRHETSEDGDAEYGIPSTHTINTIALYVYLVHHYNYYGVDGVSRHPTGRYLYENLGDTAVMQILLAVVVWCGTVMYSRLYLGMHSPVDVLSGACIAGALVVFWITCEEFLDAWITQGWLVPVWQFLFQIAMVHAYPTPMRKTPSYTFVVYFLGTCLGVTCGVWFGYEDFHSPEAATHTIAARGALLSMQGALWTAKRFLVGLVLVLTVRALAKEVAKVLVPTLAQKCGIECTDHDLIKAKHAELVAEKGADKAGQMPALVGSNSNTGVRVVTYAAVGWTVTHTAPLFFGYMNI